MFLALSFPFASAGSSRLAKIPIIATTTKSSISVNPKRRAGSPLDCFNAGSFTKFENRFSHRLPLRDPTPTHPIGKLSGFLNPKTLLLIVCALSVTILP